MHSYACMHMHAFICMQTGKYENDSAVHASTCHVLHDTHSCVHNVCVCVCIRLHIYAGKVDNKPAAPTTSCKDCAPGTISADGQTECDVCADGTYADANATVRSNTTRTYMHRHAHRTDTTRHTFIHTHRTWYMHHTSQTHL